MNLSALTDPLPKPEMNVNVNILTANQIINNGFISSLFSCYQTGAVTLISGASSSTLCNTSVIASSNFNLGTNLYTAPVSGQYDFYASVTILSTIASSIVSGSLQFLVNGVGIYPARLIAIASSAVGQGCNVDINCPLQLLSGDVVSCVATNTINGPCSFSNMIFFGNISNS